MADSSFNYVRTCKELLAGGVAGTLGIVVGLPFDLVKVRMQVQPDRYKSGIDCFLRSVKKDGFTSLYRGMMAPVVSQMPINAVLFAAEEAATRFLEPGVPKVRFKAYKALFVFLSVSELVFSSIHCITILTVFAHFPTLPFHTSLQAEHKVISTMVAGAFAGCVSCFVLVPFDRVKCLVQADGVKTLKAGEQRAYR